jgi:CysZ protein
MITAAREAFGIVTGPGFRSVLLRSGAITLVLLALVWAGLLYAFGAYLAPALVAALGGAEGSWLGTAVTAAAGVALAALMFAVALPVLLFVSRLYLKRVLQEARLSFGDAVRADPAPPAPVDALRSALRFLARAVPVYVVLSPLALVPGLNVIVFGAANAYLVGRHQFLMVAEEVGPAEEAVALYRANRLTVVLAGALIVAVSAVPLANLLAPSFAATLMLRIHGRLSSSPGGGTARMLGDLFRRGEGAERGG